MLTKLVSRAAAMMVTVCMITLFSSSAFAGWFSFLDPPVDPTATTAAACAQCNVKKTADLADAKRKVDSMKKALAQAQADYKVAAGSGNTEEMLRINRRVTAIKAVFNRFVKDTNVKLGGLEKELKETEKDLGARIDGVEARINKMNKDLVDAIGQLYETSEKQGVEIAENKANIKKVGDGLNELGKISNNHEARLRDLENDRPYKLLVGIGYNSGWTDVATGVGSSAMELQLGVQWIKHGSFLGLQAVGAVDRVNGSFGVPTRVAWGMHFDAVIRVDRMLAPNLPLQFAPTIGYIGQNVSPNGPGTPSVFTNGLRLGVQVGTEMLQLFGAWSNNDGGAGENYSAGLMGTF